MNDVYSAIVSASRDFITLIRGSDLRYVFVNPAYARAMGKSVQDIQTKTVVELWGKERFEGGIEVPLRRCLAGEEVRFIDEFPFGEITRYVEVAFLPYRESEAEEVTHALVFTHDITRLGELESKLMNYEFRDPITGLFNRRSLEIILDRELEKAYHSGTEEKRCLVILSMENLAEIRHVHGTEVGAVVLENTGVRLMEELRDSDYVFRYDADELVVLLGGLGRSTDTLMVAEKLHAAATLPYARREDEIHLKCFMGLALYPRDAQDRFGLIEKAKAALDSAREKNRQYLLYDGSLHAKAMEKMQLMSQLRRGLYENHFELHFQPLVNPLGIIQGAEALLRWRHPNRGLLSPGLFIPLVDEAGLSEELEKKVLFSVARFLGRWKDFGIYLSINLSAWMFEYEGLTDLLEAALKQAGGIDPHRLKLEIVESEGMKDPKKALRRMLDLRKRGFDIYIDDFGTGESSLRYLKELPASVLKIDKSFVDNVDTDEEDRLFLERIIDLIKTRQRKVVIEGVENAAQAAILTGMGADTLQGYYFSRPIPAQEFEDLLKARERLPRT